MGLSEGNDRSPTTMDQLNDQGNSRSIDGTLFRDRINICRLSFKKGSIVHLYGEINRTIKYLSS